MARGDTDLGQVRIIGWPDDQGVPMLDLQAVGIQQQVSPTATQLLQIAKLEAVHWIEPVTQPRIFNDRARTIMRVDPVWQKRQLFGAGQIIAVADSGLDTGNPATLSPDFVGRLVATHVVSTVVKDWGDQFGLWDPRRRFRSRGRYPVRRRPISEGLRRVVCGRSS